MPDRTQRTASLRKERECIAGAKQLPTAVGAFLDLELALGKSLRPDQNLPGNADEIRRGEFRSRPLVEIMVENIDPLALQVAIEPLGCRIGIRAALLQVEDHDLEWRHRLRPDNPRVIV